MSSLQEIKHRIKSVDNIKKITKAMQLVATTKLRRSKEKLEVTQVFYRNVFEVVNKLFSQVKDLKFLEKENANDKSLYIIINSSLSLCGAYNLNVNKIIYKQFRSQDEIIAIGSKSKSFWKAKGFIKNVTYSYDLSDEYLDYDLCSEIGRIVYERYQKGEINKIYLGLTEYKNSLTFIPKLLQLFPIKKMEIKANANKEPQFAGETVFEPGIKEVIKSIIPLYFNAIIYGSLVESKVCENASRRNAMETATNNAQDLKDKLLLNYNRSRQASITREITEIISGSKDA